jgi:hypothetical protein
MKTTFTCGGCGKKFSTERVNPVLCLKCQEKPKPKKRAKDFLPIPPESSAEFPARCFCRKEAKFSSEKLDQVFCSKACYDEAWARHEKAEQLPDAEKPHIHFTARGEAMFVCAGIGFKVDSRDLNKVLSANGERGPLDGLLDSQLAAIAHAVGWHTEPFVRDLLLKPIKGLVQHVWYRDICPEGINFNHLENNQRLRLDTYRRALLEYVPGDPNQPNRNRPRAPRISQRSIALSKSYTVVQGAKNTPSIASGRESDLLNAAKTFKSKAFTFAELVVVAKDYVTTKQDFEMICLRFLKDLIGHGAVKGV